MIKLNYHFDKFRHSLAYHAQTNPHIWAEINAKPLNCGDFDQTFLAYFPKDIVVIFLTLIFWISATVSCFAVVKSTSVFPAYFHQTFSLILIIPTDSHIKKYFDQYCRYSHIYFSLTPNLCISSFLPNFYRLILINFLVPYKKLIVFTYWIVYQIKNIPFMIQS